MDETPLYLNMPPSTTVQKIESKRVNIKTQGQENWRVTVILTILASGEKLPPLLFLKLKKENKQRKIAKIGDCGEQKSICLLTRECMVQRKYHAEMDRRHMEEILIFYLKWKTLLVLDNTTTHSTN